MTKRPSPEISLVTAVVGVMVTDKSLAIWAATGAPLGLLIRDRSSMAARGIATTGGVIDAGYRGEILVLMTNLGDVAIELKAGEKIAQMIPVPVLTGEVRVVESLEESAREAKGFGSSGR